MNILIERFPDIVGIIGVILTLIGYYYLSVNKLASTDLSYILLNLIGSWLILFSLFFHWNLASVFIEVCWITISFIGLYRYYAIKNQQLNIS